MKVPAGQQYATDIGPIDILAIEAKTKAFVVIELKKGRPSDRVIGGNTPLHGLGQEEPVCEPTDSQGTGYLS
jgi:hypothetical protein